MSEARKPHSGLHTIGDEHSLTRVVVFYRDEGEPQRYAEYHPDALRSLVEQYQTALAALDAIINTKSYVNAAGYVVTADEAQELAIKRAADLVSNPANRPSDA